MIVYTLEKIPSALEVIELYKSAALPRPVEDPDRISRMFAGSNLVVTAWEGDLLVGLSRCITDHSWCCYLSDLAVRADYQKQGIGKKLIALSKEHCGDEVMLLLLSVPAAMDYYPGAGMKRIDNAFWIERKK